MLEEFKKRNFEKNHGDYNVNMCGDIRSLHKKDGCYYSKGMYEFIPFQTLEEVKKFESLHRVNFRFCKLCFPNGCF